VICDPAFDWDSYLVGPEGMTSASRKRQVGLSGLHFADCGVLVFHPYLAERDCGAPAWKADGHRVGSKEGWAFRLAFLNVYAFWSGKRDSNPRPSAWEGVGRLSAPQASFRIWRCTIRQTKQMVAKLPIDAIVPLFAVNSS